MTTTYTNIPKATGTNYTPISGGYHLYDDTVDTYDTQFVTYDGLNHQSSYTDITKASGTTYTDIPKAT